MRTSKVFVVLGILVGVVVVGLGIGWLATRGPLPQVPAQPVSTPMVEVSNLSAPGSVPQVTRPIPRSVAPTNIQQAAIPVADTAPTTPSGVLTNWEDKLDEILSSDSDDTNKVHDLLAMFPNLPAEGQEEVAQHLSNLVEDENYAPLGKLLQDSKLSESVLDVLMADLLNRPNETKLPMFLELAKSQDHPKAGEAKDMLELYLDEDYGTDWSKWQGAMDKWLQENKE
ncbi:MAG TPA: hypothetical protein VK327_18560 [Candidatus Paceibacterota bacterium]|nr:hypothetical protein [Candidatus Paceibacterota bacterium]